jgi:type IV secretion system protein VirB5
MSMRALITAYVAPPSPEISEQQIRENPLGLFVKDFNWSEQL